MLLGHPINLPSKQQQSMQIDLQTYKRISYKTIKKKNWPPDLRKRDAVKALPHSCLHLTHCLHSGGQAVLGFGHAPVLLNEIELAMIFQIKVTNVAMWCNKFLKLGFLSDKIGLQKKDVPAATVHTVRGALELWSLSRQSHFWPQPAFTNKLFHALEPTGHGRMVFWKVKCLWCSVVHCTVVHACSTVLMCPSLLWCWLGGGTIRQKNARKKNDTPLTIRQANNASSTCFWWLGALLKRNSPCAYPSVRPLKILIALLRLHCWPGQAGDRPWTSHPSASQPGRLCRLRCAMASKFMMEKNQKRPTCFCHAEDPNLLWENQKPWAYGPPPSALEPHSCLDRLSRFGVDHFGKM